MKNERDVQNFEKFCKLLSNYKIFQNSCFIAMLFVPGLKARAIDFKMISELFLV